MTRFSCQIPTAPSITSRELKRSLSQRSHQHSIHKAGHGELRLVSEERRGELPLTDGELLGRLSSPYHY